MANEKLSVTYYQTLLDIFWPLGLKRAEQGKINVKKFEKIPRFVKKKIAKIRDV